MLSLGMTVPGGVGGMMLPGGLPMPLPPLPLGVQGIPGLGVPGVPGVPGGMQQLAGMQLPFMGGSAAGPGGLAAGANVGVGVGVGVNGLALPMPPMHLGVGAPMSQLTPAQLSQIPSMVQVRPRESERLSERASERLSERAR